MENSEKVIDDKYFAELGRFVAAYAQLEMYVRIIAQNLIGLDIEVSRALIGGMRLVDLMQSVKRIAIAKKTDQQFYDALDKHFSDVSDLSAFRDKLVHRQLNLVGGKMVLSNIGSAKSQHHIEVDFMETAGIRAKSEEAMRLMLACVPLSTQKDQWKVLSEEQRQAFPHPWFEKPVGPAKPSQQPRKVLR